MKTLVHVALIALSLAACSGDEPGTDTDTDTDGTDTDTEETGDPTTHTGTPGGVSKIWVNEIMAQNATGLTDESGAFPDWIELYNPNSEPVDLEGWWLTDDVADKFKWQIPQGVTVPAGGYLVIFADGDDADGPLHANFKLSGLAGEDVALFGPNVEDNPLVDSVEDMSVQVPDVSLARMPDGGPTWEQDTTATPAAANE